MRLILAAVLLLLTSPSHAASVRCAWVNSVDDSIVRFQHFQGTCPPNRLHKKIKWLSAPTVTPPSFDPDTQVLEGPSHSVGVSSVTQSYTVRDKTVQELDADKDNVAGSINKAVIKVLCRHENKLRGLETPPKSALTPAQCRAAFKGLL